MNLPRQELHELILLNNIMMYFSYSTLQLDGTMLNKTVKHAMEKILFHFISAAFRLSFSFYFQNSF